MRADQGHPGTHAAWALVLSVAFAGCRERAPDATAQPPQHVASTTAPAATTAQARQSFDLDGMRVEAQLPGLRMLADQSDPASGMVAFGTEEPRPDRTLSLFLDGSRSALLPKSADEALATVLADDACRAGPCVELSRGTLPDAGLMISIAKPNAVYTETWRRNAQKRVVRCGCEQSELGATATAGARWLADANERAAAQHACESLCRAVIPQD